MCHGRGCSNTSVVPVVRLSVSVYQFFTLGPCKMMKTIKLGRHVNHDKRTKSLNFGLVGCFYVTLAIFQPYRDLETGDNQSLKS